MQLKNARLRKTKNIIFITSTYCAIAIGGMTLISILTILVQKGLPNFNLNVFTQDIPLSSASLEGGLRNAIVGSLMIGGCAILIGTVLGCALAVVMQSLQRFTALSKVVYLLNDILLAMPSILIGVLVFISYVAISGSFSGIAGIIALTLIAMPIVARINYNLLRMIPKSLNESAIALGVPRWRILIQIMFKIIHTGLISSIFLALARILGETAPLLFTGFGNSQLSFNLQGPMETLPISIFDLISRADTHSHNLAWTGALIITIIVLVLNLIGKAKNKELHND